MEDKKSLCLHCNHKLEDNYCSHCGQKASTHRYSLKHFFMHDFVHGVFHFDKGALYTVKELFTRPGHSVREFVEGKRAKHFNLFTFIFLVVTLGHILASFTSFKMSDLMQSEQSIDVTHQFEIYQRENPKTFSLAQIPLLALFSMLLFRKSKQNYTEHLVLNTYKSSAELLLGTVFTAVTIFYRDMTVLGYFVSVIVLSVLLYSIWFYYQYFSAFGYSKVELMIRSVLASISIYLLTILLTIVYVRVVDAYIL
jgi:hypothetical protein